MASIGGRLRVVVKGLSPEDTARLIIEDTFRDQPVLSAAERRKMANALDEKEAPRYTAFIDRYTVLRRNFMQLTVLAGELHKNMLKRDGLLWYREALVRMEEAISLDTFDTGVSKALLVDNSALKPGKPVDIAVPFPTVRLGVWGRKRNPVSDHGGVEFVGEFVDALDRGTDTIRSLARVLKALHSYVTEEAGELGLEGVREMANAAVEEVAGHDLTMKKIQRSMDERARRWNEEGLTYEERLQRIVAEEADPPADSIFPVDSRWALEWDEVEEDSETARFLRENPDEWMSRRS
jgi:hypothetical protein